VDAEALWERRGEVQILDVRWPNEWEAGRIEGSIHIQEYDVFDHLDDLDRARAVVCVCQWGNRSQAMATLLREEGFDADSLEGGVDAWVTADLPFTTPSGEPGEVVDPDPPPDDRPEHLQELEAVFHDALFAVQERFGDTEPSEEELRTFLRQRLIVQGRTPAEADAIMARIDEPPPAGA
jgi:rhodanese-related sulfurtransferase